MSVIIDCNSIETCIYNAVKLPRHFKYSAKHVYIDYILRSARFHCYVESRSGIINITFTHVFPRLKNTISAARTRFFNPNAIQLSFTMP